MAYPNRSHSLKEGEGTQLHLHTLMKDFFEENLKNQRKREDSN
jgi:dipeptidyl-peptidase-4